MTTGHDPDKFFYMMDSCPERRNACTPPEGTTDRHYKNIFLQALPLEHGRIHRAHLELRDFGRADIWQVISIYADNLSRSSTASSGFAGPGAAI